MLIQLTLLFTALLFLTLSFVVIRASIEIQDTSPAPWLMATLSLLAGCTKLLVLLDLLGWIRV